MGSAPEVEIRMPAESSSIRLARLVAAAMGSRIGLLIEDVEDLRMAVDELCYWLIGDADGDTGREFVLTFAATPGSLDVRGTAVGPGWEEDRPEGDDAAEDDMSPLSRRIVDALADEYHCTRAPGLRAFSLLKLSRS